MLKGGHINDFHFTCGDKVGLNVRKRVSLNISITLTVLWKQVMVFGKLKPVLFFCKRVTKTQTFDLERTFPI